MKTISRLVDSIDDVKKDATPVASLSMKIFDGEKTAEGLNGMEFKASGSGEDLVEGIVAAMQEDESIAELLCTAHGIYHELEDDDDLSHSDSHVIH